jgi:hypothetical protein
MGPHLNRMGKGSDQQIATEPLGRVGAMQLTPDKSQFIRRSHDQLSYLATDFGWIFAARAVA